MKNIHLIETDKPSRLGYLTKKGKEVYKDLRLFDKPMPNILDSENQHIYITSDEEIKEGDYRLNIQRDYFKKSDKEGLDYYNKRNDIFKKIILTTDQDLINDGVQAIDDEFLEGFVTNPSCEEVEVTTEYKDGYGNWFIYDKEFWDKINNEYKPKFGLRYKIIIPKEEPKQETYTEAAKKEERIFNSTMMKQETIEEEPKQQTLKEEFYKYGKSLGISINDLQRLMLLSKQQQQQNKNIYSEEDMREAYFTAIRSTGEGWNGEYANGNCPNIEKTFNDGFEIFIEQYKTK
jgi:hypothetical protein